jgi:hypothetical protein
MQLLLVNTDPAIAEIPIFFFFVVIVIWQKLYENAIIINSVKKSLCIVLSLVSLYVIFFISVAETKECITKNMVFN